MRRGLIKGLAAALAIAMAAPAPAADGRRMLSAAEAADWTAVGRLNVAGRRFCTATLIAPDLAITAAHCLFNPRTRRQTPTTELRFVAGLRLGGHAGWRRVSAAAIPAGYRYDGDPSAELIGGDVALLALETPFGPDAGVRPATTAPAQAGPKTIVSYARDRAHAPSIEEGCDAKARQGPITAFDCTVKQGASGSPVFAGSGPDRRLVAVVSASGGGRTGGVAIAVDVEPLLTALKVELGR